MKAVAPEITELIFELQALKGVESFSLAGGTNLALRYNHRVSDDIDLFTDKTIGVIGLENIAAELRSRFKSDLKFCEIINTESGNQFCFLRALITRDGKGIKTEFIQNVYRLSDIEVINGLRLLSVKDIGIMKLLSAAARKANKDIYDLDLITDEIPLEHLWQLLEYRQEHTKEPELKNLFDLDGDSGLLGNISLLLEFDKIDYSTLPQRPSHSSDRIFLLPSGKKWAVAGSGWKRKVREFMRKKGIEPPSIKPVN